MTKEQFKALNMKQSNNLRSTNGESSENHETLLSWMKKLRLFYETDSQIYVHGGTDVRIPKEKMKWYNIGISDEIFTGESPTPIGCFYKDIIIAQDGEYSINREGVFNGTYFRGKNPINVYDLTEKNKGLLCLVFDEKKGKYYQFEENEMYIVL